jgi:dipeptidyl aminopeptidase/acylaminoacyl peptidase
MKNRNRLLVALVVGLKLLPQGLVAKPFQIEDLHRLQRPSDAQLSPDGKWVAFTAARSDVAANRTGRNLWLVSAAGGEARPLTFAEKGSNTRPRWAPDSQFIYFVSSRVDDTAQIFKLPLAGGEAAQVTHSPVAIDSFVLSPDGQTIAFTVSVDPDCPDLAASKKKSKEADSNPVKARVIKEIPYRRWDTWVDGKRNHIFVQPAAGGKAHDLTPGDFDSPIWTENGSEEVAFSPDGKEICFSRYTESEGFVGNSDLFTLPVTGGTPKPITSNRGTDTTPLYSPDGQHIAYTATPRPGVETDQPRLWVYHRATGERTNLSESLDRPVTSYAWSTDGKSLWATLEDIGQSPLVRIEVATAKVTPLVEEGTYGELQVSSDGKFLVYAHSDFSRPTEFYRHDLEERAKPVALTRLNSDLVKEFEFGQARSFTFAGWNNEPVQCWEVRPPGFVQDKKYPLLLLMHGGPEAAWHNQFHYRWNAQVFAAAGYVVLLPNFHGSAGFGLRYLDSIKGQWGGAPYEDQMKAVDEALKWPYVDGTRLAAAGASYGGYMANWVAGHTDRFRAIINHDGCYDLLGSWFSADLPGGVEPELKGAPWANPQALIDQSPITFAKNFKTPMLIIHGEKDYRVDPSNGFATFAVLQAMKIPSKLLYFPDENHWVLKPANSILWYHTVLDWLEQWVKPDQADYEKLRKGK